MQINSSEGNRTWICFDTVSIFAAYLFAVDHTSEAFTFDIK